MKKNLSAIFLFILIIFLDSCSTQKNTFITRSYHSITSKYNILFNGNESFKKGYQSIVDNYKDDFTEILPVFYYENKEQALNAASDMDRSIKKTEKLVSLHSITVKPEIKNNKPLSDKQREFHNKKEYNWYVDENYLLMGKSYFYKHEFDKAKETFMFMINEYKDNKTLYETKIWLARTYNETKEYKNAEEILRTLDADINFPRHLRGDLYTTYSDFYIRQGSYEKAVSYLKKAIGLTGKKRLRVRYTFILAQLYERTGKMQKASEIYGKVVKMNPPYEMTFHARINRALAYEKGYGSRKDIENQLFKMLKDDKNIEYQDQIYYALGNLAAKEGDKKAAIERYRKSIDKNTGNTDQKALSYLTLANLYYDKPDYINAQAYYDSTVSMIDISYPEYDMIYAKSQNLTSLVKEYTTVTFEDSVQKLAKLPLNDLMTYIDKIIKDVTDQEEASKYAEQQRQLDEQYGLQMAAQSNNLTAANSGAQWYFYNETSKALGYKEFRMKWGNRRLEDNWGRKNKSLSSFGTSAPAENSEFITDEESKNVEIADNKSRDFYLKDIPLNDSMLRVSDKRIEDALFNMGMIYKNDLKDNEKAIQSFKDLINRYPNTDYLLQAYYQLYTIYKLDNNQAMAESYKNRLVSRFPESSYAKLLTNPNYLKELEQSENEVKNYYEATYDKFRAGNYNEVISRYNYAQSKYADDRLMPQFAYLNALSIGKTQDLKTFREHLFELISKYPGTEVSENARNIIAFMDKEKPSFKEEEEKAIAQKLYNYNVGDRHFFGFVIPRGVNANQLIFNIINFNLDNYDKLNLRVETAELNNKQTIVVIKSFQDKNKSMEYYQTISADKDVFKDVDSTSIISLVISEPNMEILQTDKSAERYMKFFSENYFENEKNTDTMDR